MTDDVWNALAKTTELAETTHATVERLLDAVDGPLVTRLDGSTGRDRERGVLGQQEATNRQLAEMRARLEAIAEAPTKISMPRWWTPIAVALIGGLVTVLVAVLQTLRAVT